MIRSLFQKFKTAINRRLIPIFWKIHASLYKFSFSKLRQFLNSVASGPGISRNLEIPGNFVAREKCQRISWNSEKSGNFNKKLWKVREFYLREMNIAEVFSRFFQVVKKN